jgi:predicted membrane-bound dolichyl-phosphate-mannose-protein mannosyltransferase
MAKLLLLAVIVGTIAIPILAARQANARRGLWNAVTIVVVFNLLYLLAVLFVYPHLN